MADVEPLLAAPDRLMTLREAVSAWSPAQHIDHVLAVNNGVCAQVLAMAAAGAVPEHAGGRPTPIGRALLALGWIPRGRGRAPRAVRPAEQPDVAHLKAAWSQHQDQFGALEPLLPRLSAVPGRIKHPVFGMLSAVEWVRFLRIHTHHHWKIMADIASA